MMGQQTGGQDRLFYSFNLEDHVPAHHLLRGIDQFLDFAVCASIWLITYTARKPTIVTCNPRLIGDIRHHAHRLTAVIDDCRS